MNRELHHRNLVALREVILEDKSIYMVFEYAEHDFLVSIPTSPLSNQSHHHVLGHHHILNHHHSPTCIYHPISSNYRAFGTLTSSKLSTTTPKPSEHPFQPQLYVDSYTNSSAGSTTSTQTFVSIEISSRPTFSSIVKE